MEINESQITKQKSPIHINLSQNEIFSENSQNSQETPRFESEQLPSIQNKNKKIYSDNYPQLHQNKQQPKIINLNNNKISNKNQNNSPQKPPKHNTNQNLQFQIKNQNNYENLSQKIKNNILNLNQNQHSEEKIHSQQQIPVQNQIQINQRQIRSQTSFQSQLHSQRQKNFDQNLKTIDQLDLLLDSNRNLKEDESIYQQSYDQPPDQINKYNSYQFNQNIVNNQNNNNSNYSQIQNQQQEIQQLKQNYNQTQNQQFQNSSQPFSQQKILQTQKIQQSSKLSQNASKFLQQSTQSQTDQMNFTLFNSNHSLESQNNKNNSLKLIEFQKANNSSQNTNFSYYDPSQNYKNKNNKNNIYKKGYSYDDQSTKQSNIGSSSKIVQVQSSRKKKDYNQIFQEILEYDSRSKSAAKPLRVEDQEFNINNQNQNLSQNQDLNQIHFPLITNNNFQNTQKKFKINQNALLQMKNIDISGSEFLNEFLPKNQNISKINQNQSFHNNNSQLGQSKQHNSIQQQNLDVQNQEQNQNVYKNFSEFVTKIQQDKIPSDIEKQIQQQDQITQFTNRKLISMQNSSNNNNTSSIMKKTAKFGEKIQKSRQLSKNENDLIFD
ncbi:hypothetical protein PPERSA_13131 [Pseudocohnilembus persalinus]|uniref:Uncharacterized protein n=1 Tax=Pseudocohnilembus persalinus TaxID=266149 RepID=A0A0V0QWA5_PSEPJ|nr:hypothetical protein PPERSA_13131 [Pseudocohnilembus persalinus]|eukprot:KRX06652.1 hypothetical protein PPERSA_13131 [Pseudocohnilembus persalinus]